jgi:hypothetical protein
MPDDLIPESLPDRMSIREALLLMAVLLSFTFAALKLPPPAPAEKSMSPVRSLGQCESKIANLTPMEKPGIRENAE